MAFRTLIIDTHSKVEYSLEYLVFRTPETIKRVLLDEVHTIIFQSTAISVTTSLLAELVKRKIKVIFCDEKKNPISELYSYYGAHNTSGRIFEQLSIKEESKGIIWKRIVEEKIKNQAISLRKKYKYDASIVGLTLFNSIFDRGIFIAYNKAAKSAIKIANTFLFIKSSV